MVVVVMMMMMVIVVFVVIVIGGIVGVFGAQEGLEHPEDAEHVGGALSADEIGGREEGGAEVEQLGDAKPGGLLIPILDGDSLGRLVEASLGGTALSAGGGL